MKVKTSELKDHALDWAVASAIGHLEANRVVVDFKYMSGEDPVRWEPQLDTYYSSAYSPTTNWAQGGSIIEREKITVCWQGATWVGSKFNVRVTDEYEFHQTGPTPLIAAMRCYVASKLGDTIDVPDELI